jgi:predicted Zn-dependent peptidase
VREKQIAADASAFTFDLAKGSDILVADVTALPGTSPEQLEAEVESEIDRLANDGVSAEEVARAVALIETDMTTAMQSAGERADRLSKFATLLDDPGLVNTQADRYRSVTVAQVNAFASDRLARDNRATLLYVPRPEQAGDASTELLGVAAS